jgi:hypothetical protein
LLKVFKQQPGASGPHITPLAAGVRFTRNFDCMRKVLIKVLMNYVVLRINEARIEVAFEHHQHALHRWIWLCILCHQRKGRTSSQHQAGSHSRHGLYKITTLHFELPPLHFNRTGLRLLILNQRLPSGEIHSCEFFLFVQL